MSSSSSTSNFNRLYINELNSRSGNSMNSTPQKEAFMSVLGSFLEGSPKSNGSYKSNGKGGGSTEPMSSSEFIKRFDKFANQQQELVSYIKGLDNKIVAIQKNVEDQTNKVKSITDRLPQKDDKILTPAVSVDPKADSLLHPPDDFDDVDEDEEEEEDIVPEVEEKKVEEKKEPEADKKKTLSELLEERTKQNTEPLSRKVWQSVLVLVILYNLVAVPFRIAFMNPYDRLFIWMDILCFTIYFGDFLFKYQTSKINQDQTAQEKLVRQLMNQSERESIRKHFDRFDKDKNGHITPAELSEVMASIGEKVDWNEIQNIIAEVDLNKNGTIEFNEFCDFVEKFRRGRSQNQKKFGEVFVKNAVDSRSIWFYLDTLCALPIHLIIGCSYLRFISLIVPSNLFLFLFQSVTSLFFLTNPEAQSDYFSFQDPFNPLHPYGNLFESLPSDSFEKFSFDGKNSHYDYFSHYDKSIFGLGLETTQFFLLFQLLKFAQLYTLIHELEKKLRFIKPTIFRLVHLVMLSFLIAHWVGCAWFLVGRLEGYGTNEWVPSLDLVQSSLLTQYVRALYWGFVNTTNIESASPTNTVEALFSLAVLFVGVSMYATIIGNVGSLLSNLDSTAVMFREKLDSITAYMHYKEIPPAIQARVHDYYEYLWHRQKGLDESEILRDLPNSMRTDIALYLNRDVLEKVPFFQNASENLLSVLVKLLKPQVCAPGEFIIRYGDIGREMYFINRGVVIVCSEDGKAIYNVLSDGSFFGEYALLFSQKRSASVQSSTYCDLFVLTQEDFQTVLNDFPEFALAMRKEGVKRIIEKLSFFKDFSKEFRDMLVELLRAQSFVGGEYIVRKGDIGDEMYFLIKGTAEVCSGDGKTIYKILKEGDFFGEFALLTSQTRAASVRTIGYCDTFVLSRADLHTVLKKFPVYKKKMRILKQQINAQLIQTVANNNNNAPTVNPAVNNQANK